jgi:hypothetical protein
MSTLSGFSEIAQCLFPFEVFRPEAEPSGCSLKMLHVAQSAVAPGDGAFVGMAGAADRTGSAPLMQPEGSIPPLPTVDPEI